MYAKIYAHTGNFGVDGTGTGTPLATSDVISASVLDTSFQLIEFTFTGSDLIQIADGTPYVVVIEITDGDLVWPNRIQVALDNTSPTHDGNGVRYRVSTGWTITSDVCFYVYGNAQPIEYIKVGDFKLEEVISGGEQQQRLTLSLSSPIDYASNHYQPLTTEYKSTVSYQTSFLDSNMFNADWQVSGGCTTGVTGLLIIQSGENQDRHMILGKYNDLSDVRILTTFARGTAATSTRAFSQVFRYTDENNYMFVRYDNNPAGTIILGDITWNGTTAMETRLATVTGVSIRSDTPFYLYTVVHNDRVTHFGSTDGWQYTKHFDIDNLYGSSWQASVKKFANTVGSVGFLTLGSSSGSFYVPEFQVDSLSDQYTYDTSIRHVSGAGGVFGVSIRNEFFDMTEMRASAGSSWLLTSNSAIRFQQSNGASWDTLFTSGATFEDFVATCHPVAESLRATGMMFGNTTSFYMLWVTPGRDGGAMERYDAGRFNSALVGSHVCASNNVPFEFKMAKSGSQISWYMNGVLLGTAYGTTSGDILNSAGRVGVVTWGQTSLGVTATFTDLRISTLDYPVETFLIEGNNSPRVTLERFVPRGNAISTSSKGLNIIEVGASRGTFTINSDIRDVSLSERYKGDPAHVSTRGEKYSFNLPTGISRSMIRTDDSHIIGNNDSNIISTKNASDIATENMREENSEVFRASTSINAVPTLEVFDKVTVVDTALGESAVYLVEGINKSYDSDGAFIENLQLTRNGN